MIRDAKRDKRNIQDELRTALVNLSAGRLTFEEANDMAKEYAAEYDVERFPTLAHKGICWYAKDLLKAKKIVPQDYRWIESIAYIEAHKND